MRNCFGVVIAGSSGTDGREVGLFCLFSVGCGKQNILTLYLTCRYIGPCVFTIFKAELYLARV